VLTQNPYNHAMNNNMAYVQNQEFFTFGSILQKLRNPGLNPDLTIMLISR